MGKFIDLKNKKFGKRLCLKYLGCGKWLCRCDCGYKSSVSGNSLTSNKSTQCHRCFSRSRVKKIEFREAFFNTYIRTAKSRNLEFNITKDYVYSLFLYQNRKCAISGVDICFAKTSDGHAHGETTASLDRIDSSKGYIKGNVQWVHKSINKMKNGLLEQRFLELCQKIAIQNSK